MSKVVKDASGKVIIEISETNLFYSYRITKAASKNMYVYDANTGEFANFVANVASSADIDSLFV